eukprot:jgi/Ulvmu1/2348/UM013_0196.1
MVVVQSSPGSTLVSADGAETTHFQKRSNHNTYDQDERWRENIRGEDADFSTQPDGSRPAWFWTGKPPTPETPGMQADGTLTSLPLPNLHTASRQDVLDYFDNTWLITEVIFSGLQSTEAFYRPPGHNLRHPMIFYYGHPAALYVNKLRVAGLLSEPVNAVFEHIFETGVDEMGWDDLSKNDMLWPLVREVTEYRRRVYALVRKVLEAAPEPAAAGVAWEHPAWAAFMGFEHERIHIETSTVLIRELPLEYVQEPRWWPKAHEELSTRLAPENPLMEHAAATVTVGKPRDWPSYGWDNEYGRRALAVPPFAASRFQVTNGEFIEFVRDGGYRDETLWSSDGWRWRTFRNAKWPPFWVPHGPAGLHQYRLRLIWCTVPFAAAAPVVVNRHEAHAYCAWRTRAAAAADPAAPPFRLLAEAEHHVLRSAALPDPFVSGTAPLADPAMATNPAADPLPAASGAALRDVANVQLAYGAEAPVDAFAEAESGGGAAFGNVWSWCEDWFSALPGGHGVHPFYDDFSAPCYDGEHAVIMGGSFMSTGDEASRFARFHFRPHFHQHAGFYVVQSASQPPLTHVDSPPPHVGAWNPSSSAAAGATTPAVTAAALMHYGSARSTLAASAPALAAALPQYAATIARVVEAAVAAAGAKAGSVLEVGASVGGVAFRLAEVYGRVTAIERDSQMVALAQRLQAEGSAVLSGAHVQGSLVTDVRVARPVNTDVGARVAYRLMDPCCIAPDIGQYDAVLISEVLDRTVSPKAALGRVSGVNPIVKRGGLVVVVTGCDWDPEMLDERQWLGGAPVPVAGAVPGPPFAAVTNGNGHKSNGHATNGKGHKSDGTNGGGHNSNGHATNGNGDGTGGSAGAHDSHAAAPPPPTVHARHAIQAVLGDEFEFVSATDVPRVGMEHCRKFTLQCMHVLVWKFTAARQ